MYHLLRDESTHCSTSESCGLLSVVYCPLTDVIVRRVLRIQKLSTRFAWDDCATRCMEEVSYCE